MTTPLSRPEVVINYSPKLDLHITLLAVQGYGRVALPDYRFEMDCRLQHPTGSFSYSANDLYFDLESFERFSTELQGVQQGLRQEAALKDAGQMVVLRLEGNSRALQATLEVREYLPPSMPKLNAPFELHSTFFFTKLPG